MIAKYSSTTRPLKRESENIPIWRHVIFPYTMYRADRGTQKAVPWRDKHGTAAIVRVMECTVCTSIVHFYRRLSWLTRVTLELIGMGIATCLRCGFGVYYGLTRQGTFSRGSFMPGWVFWNWSYFPRFSLEFPPPPPLWDIVGWYRCSHTLNWVVANIA